jgi:enterochelin esterase-like enzyme
LRETFVDSFKPEALKNGSGVMYDGPEVIFAFENEKTPALRVDDMPGPALKRIPDSNLWYVLATLKAGEVHSFRYMDGETPLSPVTDIPIYGHDSYPRPGVPEGKLSGKLLHTSKIYPGMTSEYWIYTPPDYDSKVPLPIMVWQDGYAVAPRLGPVRLPVVTENLIAQKKIPPMIHIMISPGTVGEKKLRSEEYDTVSDTYFRFLTEEILAEVGAKYNLRKDAYSRAIAGMSSGAICAFNVAWRHTDEFSRVASYIGSYTAIGWRRGQADPKDNLDGGNVYPFLVRKEPRRNIRIWLDDGSEDIEAKDGSWPLQNIQMANSLKMAGYDFHFHFGLGLHSLSSMAAGLPEVLTWLWRDYDPSKTAETYEQETSEKVKPLFRVKIINR